MMQKFFLKSFVALLLSISLNCYAGIDFDGVDDTISCGDTASFDNLSNMSFYFVIKFDTLGANRRIVEKWGNDDGTRQFVVGEHYTVGQEDELLFGIREGATGDYSLYKTTTLNMQTGVWYRVAASWESNNTWLCNVNGTAYTLTLDQSAGTTITTGVGTNALTINSSTSQQSGAGYVDGIITEVALWSTTLTANELDLLTEAQIKNLPLQVQSSNLKFYCPIDDQETGTSADGDTVRDLSGQGNNGTGDDGANNTGLAWIGETVLSYPPGVQ